MATLLPFSFCILFTIAGLFDEDVVQEGVDQPGKVTLQSPETTLDMMSTVARGNGNNGYKQHV